MRHFILLSSLCKTGAEFQKKYMPNTLRLKSWDWILNFDCQKTDNGRLCYVVDGTGIIDILGSGLKLIWDSIVDMPDYGNIFSRIMSGLYISVTFR